jgi:hypothetical protein
MTQLGTAKPPKTTPSVNSSPGLGRPRATAGSRPPFAGNPIAVHHPRMVSDHSRVRQICVIGVTGSQVNPIARSEPHGADLD